MDSVTGKSKGFGFVDMPEDSEAAAAIKALDGKLIHGEKIRVKKTVRPSEYKPERVPTKRFEGREMRKPSRGKSSVTPVAKSQRPKR